jgi:predicted nucleic acid-binding protein
VGAGYLIDSNAVIDFFNYSLPRNGINLLINIEPRISIITQIKVFSKRGLEVDEVNGIKEFINTTTVYVVDEMIALKTIDIRLKHKMKLPDAIIAATAIYYDLILITRNVSDFNRIAGLQIINPHAV